MTAETFDAVLAEMRELADAARPTIAEIRPSSALLAEAVKAVSSLLDRVDDWRDRLAAAHAAEVAELDATRLQQGLNIVAAIKRADAATALLRECLPYIEGHAQASHLTDGFKRRPNNAHDDLAARVAWMVGRA